MGGPREGGGAAGGGGVGWLSVPAFGEWDQKHDGVPDYSIDFSKIREMRKQNKKDLSRLSIGNDEELINPTAGAAGNHRVVGSAVRPPPPTNAARIPHRSPSGSPTKREKLMRYLNCCVSA